MRILGLDPGIATVGFGLLDSSRGKTAFLTCGTITTPAHTSLSSRLDQIYSDLQELIRAYHPDAMAIEELFFNTNITTGISVAQGRGVMLLCAYREGISVYEYTPLQVKQAVAGYGRADKRQVQEMVKRLLNLSAIPKPDDAADAVALALCHARSSTSLIAAQTEGETGCSTI
jgi:crossover junction endodeoxyribonuclease RuvC